MFRPSLAKFRVVLIKERRDGQLRDRCAVVMLKYTCRVKHALQCLKHGNVSHVSPSTVLLRIFNYKHTNVCVKSNDPAVQFCGCVYSGRLYRGR